MIIRKWIALVFVFTATHAQATPAIEGTYNCKMRDQGLTSQITIDVNGREVRLRGYPGGTMSALENDPIICENKKVTRVEENLYVKATSVSRCSRHKIQYGVLMEFGDGSSVDIQAQIVRLNSSQLMIKIQEVDKAFNLNWTTSFEFQCERIAPYSVAPSTQFQGNI